MQQDSMNAIDPRISHELRPGEQLLWWGKPDPAYWSQRRALRIYSLRFWSLFCFCMFLLLCDNICLFLSFPPTPVTQVNLLGLIIFVSLLLFFFLWQSITVRFVYEQMRVRRKDLHHTVYAITTQRIVEVVENKAVRVRSCSRADIGMVDRAETRDGWGDLTYGKPVSISFLPTSLTTSRMAGIPDVRAVQELVLRTFKDTA